LVRGEIGCFHAPMRSDLPGGDLSCVQERD
jgi:hypothetical protein